MTIVAETLPDTSKPACILIYVLAVSLLQSTVICLETILGLNLFHRSDSLKVSRGWVKFTHMLRCSNRKRNEDVVFEFSNGKIHRGQKTQANCLFESDFTLTDVAESLDKVLFRSTIACTCVMTLIYVFIVCTGPTHE